MHILLDESPSHRLARLLIDHDVGTVAGMAWSGLTNGALLDKAASAFDVILTADQNIEFQQNYEPPRVMNRTWLKVETGGASLGQILRTEAEEAGLPVVATGLSSVSRYAVMQRGEMLSVYCPRSAPLLKRFPNMETDCFPNLELVESQDQPLYFDSPEEDGFFWASPVQAYLELMAGDKRDWETGEQVRAYLLDRLGSSHQ